MIINWCFSCSNRSECRRSPSQVMDNWVYDIYLLIYIYLKHHHTSYPTLKKQHPVPGAWRSGSAFMSLLPRRESAWLWTYGTKSTGESSLSPHYTAIIYLKWLKVYHLRDLEGRHHFQTNTSRIAYIIMPSSTFGGNLLKRCRSAAVPKLAAQFRFVDFNLIPQRGPARKTEGLISKWSWAE